MYEALLANVNYDKRPNLRIHLPETGGQARVRSMTTDALRDSRPMGAGWRGRDKPTRQELQKQESRARILAAAKDVLSEMGYAAMRVEDVIARAGISRATFYKHFESKFAIGRALHAEFAPRLNAVFDMLLEYEDPTEAELADWVARLVALYRNERVLIITFAHMLAIEPLFHTLMIDLIRDIELRWAERLPAFRVPHSNSPDAMAARIESRLLMRQINDFCHEVATFDWSIDEAEGCRIMAGQFRRFLERYGVERSEP